MASGRLVIVTVIPQGAIRPDKGALAEPAIRPDL